MRAIAVGILVVVGCDAHGGTAPVADDGISGGRAVDPGVCLGAHTRCDMPPATTTFATEPLVACQPVDHRSAASIVWKTSLGEITCPVGKCVAEAVDVAMDPDGGVWVESKLLLPSQAVITDDDPHGLGLSRIDGDGKVAVSTVVDFRTFLAGDAPLTHGMRVDSRGHLLLLAPMPGRPGLELRDYDHDARLVGTRPLVDLARAGTASIDADGALSLVYSYEPGGDAGTADPLDSLQADGVARFDANGIPLWNQMVSRLLWPGNRGGSNAYAIFGARATAIVDFVPAGATPQKVAAAVLDDLGNISEVAEQQEATVLLSIPTGPTSFAAVYRPMSPAGSPDFVTTFGVDAVAASHFDRAALSFPEDEFIGIDADGRTWSFAWSDQAELHAASGDGNRCSSWTIGTETCARADAQLDCISPVLTVPKNDEVYFAGAGIVGVVGLGGLP